jgi:maltose O-acetyltransferase
VTNTKKAAETETTSTTEREKMLAGKPYISSGPELFGARQAAKELLFDFNALRPGQVEERNAILRRLFGRIGEKFFVEPPFRCDYGSNIAVGENFYANYDCVVLDCAVVTIGDNVLFGPGVHIYTAGHPAHPEPRNAGIEYAMPVTIGNNVWLGGGVIVTPGVTIGENAVIGAGSVVTRDVPPSAIAAGNPCRALRTITDEDRKFYFRRLPFEEPSR